MRVDEEDAEVVKVIEKKKKNDNNKQVLNTIILSITYLRTLGGSW